MKRLLIIIACALTGFAAHAENERLTLAVAVDKQQMTDNAEVLRLLVNKLTSAMSAAGCGTAAYSSTVVSPATTTTARETIETAMRKIIVYDVDLTINVSQIITNAGINAVSINLRGEGYSEKAAMMSAINKLSTNDNRLRTFFTDTKAKILKYYTDNRKNIINKAHTLASMEQYEEAMALLTSYPETISGYDDVLKEMNNVYSLYQQKNCNELLQKANGAYAVGNYEEAVEWLNLIDGLSPCAGEAEALTSKIKKSTDEEKRQSIALYQQQMKTAADIEKRRIQACENIAVAYYKSRTSLYFVF